MAQLRLSFQSSIGRKFWVGISGIVLVTFVLGHLSGNLLLYAGQDAFNQYGKTLEDLGALTWLARAGILSFFLLHVVFALMLAKENRAARGGEGYKKKNFQRASNASRLMLLTGLTLLAFILYHLAHFTFHWVHFTGMNLDDQGRRDIYTMVVLGFQNPWIASLYIAAMCFLALHLKHAIPSVFQTLGLDHTKVGTLAEKIGCAIAALVFVGYVSIPVSVWLGCIGLQGVSP